MKYLALAAALLLALAGCTPTKAPASPNAVPAQPTKELSMTTKHYTQAPGKLDEAQRANKEAVIETKKGTIRFKLLADAAPLTVSNFIFLANDHFYDALTFHRVESGFVVQGGDPNGNGTGGPGYTFADEPVTRAYTRGIVAMANSGPNTNGSQFFIVLADTPLPPQYTIFGEVTEGMETVDAIAIGDEMTTVIIRDTQ